MKFKKPLSWAGIALILTMLLLFIIPTASALAVGALTMTPSSGIVGQSVAITGAGFTPGTTNLGMYFSNQNVNIYAIIDQDVTSYKYAGPFTVDANGNLTGPAFVIPSSLDSGTTVTAVTPGAYYFYVCQFNASNQAVIITKGGFTVNANATLSAASPATGAPGTPITLTGTGFLPSHTLTATFDGTAVTILTGGTSSATGTVSATINAPYVAAGAHTIVVSDGTGTPSTTFTITSYIAVAPQSGPAGTSVTVAGNGFGAVKSITVYFNNQQVATTLSSTTGTFDSLKFDIPDTGLAAGSYDIKVADSVSNLATAPFQLTAPAQPTPTATATPTPTATATPTPTATPIPTPTPTTEINVITAGTNVALSGSGFEPDALITIKIDDTLIGTLTASANGGFVSQFQVASNLKHGDHTISVTDGTTTKDYTYTVESTPPDTPMPSAPANGATPPHPIQFTWNAVTDPSAPVTYDLQISSDANFASGSILVDKTGVTTSFYTLTTDEQAKLVGQSAPYYWHIRAVDAAQNQSDWSPAMEVRVAAPFGFPTWLIYTLAGVGAVIIFGIGYLVGRRTAFYY